MPSSRPRRHGRRRAARPAQRRGEGGGARSTASGTRRIPRRFEICSIGGNLATNAGGLCCVKYGVTTDYVLGLEVVLADGRAVRLGGRTIKDVAGYDLKRLFVGSEGTLGVITEATLRLRPLPPPATTIVGHLRDVVDAGRAVTAVIAARAPGRARADGRRRGRRRRGGHARWASTPASARCSSPRPTAAADEAALVAAALRVGGRDLRRRHRRRRRGASCSWAPAAWRSPASSAWAPCSSRTSACRSRGSPSCSPRSRRSPRATATPIPVIGHAGDGNFHPLVTFDAVRCRRHGPGRGRPSTTSCGAALDLGGTVTGEHGVGSLKARHLAEQLGPDVLELTRR